MDDVLNADIVVKIVMIGLLLASVATWTVLIAKTIELKRARERVNEAIKPPLGSARLGGGASRAWRRRPAHKALLVRGDARIKSLVRHSLRRPASRSVSPPASPRSSAPQALAVKRGTGLLASVGSTGPFVGLFGTVWGIMNSFIGISKAQTTNLAVVAPGIAEALLATAIGLFAAIPAVLIYNHLARQTGSYLELVSNVSGELLRIVSRDLDRGGRVVEKIHAQAAE